MAFATVPTRLGDVLAAVTADGVAATHFRDGDRVRARIAARLGMPAADDPVRRARVARSTAKSAHTCGWALTMRRSPSPSRPGTASSRPESAASRSP